MPRVRPNESPQSTTVEALARRLERSLSDSYPDEGDHTVLGLQPLRDAFAAFGADAFIAGIPLEDAMAAAAAVLQEFFSRTGGLSSDPGTTLAAGISLAASSRAFQAAEQSASGRQLGRVDIQVARLRALHAVNRAATTGVSIPELLETSVQQVTRATGADASAVLLYDPATGLLTLRAAVGLNPASVGSLTVGMEAGITGKAASTGRTIVAPDARNHPAYLDAPDVGDAIYASQVSVPMLVRGSNQLVGVLNILSAARRVFDDDEVAFLETVAGELAISIENSRMHSQTDATLRRKVGQLALLQRVSRSVASTLDLESVLRLITEAAVELIQAEAAAIFRVPSGAASSGQDGALTIEHRTGSSRRVIHEQERDDLIREVIASGRTSVQDVRYVDGPYALLCVPLQSARETWGALCIRLASEARPSEDELAILQAFTDSASLAIENAELYREARHGVETASTLLQEMHHRVRNNLQTVAALLSIQVRQDPGSRLADHLREAISRIQAIAAVHDLLSDEARLTGATIDAIAELVVDQARTTVMRPGLEVIFEIEPSDVRVPSKQATVLALLTNELVSNAIVHGFRNRAKGRIGIRGYRRGHLVLLEVENDGERLPAGFDPGQSPGLGMRIVHRLVSSDLGGDFRIESVDRGTRAKIQFPLTSPG